jgi:hypothetical protein
VRVRLVALSLRVTVAPGTTASCGSVTVPWMDVRNWAKAGNVAKRTRAMMVKRATIENCFFMLPPETSFCAGKWSDAVVSDGQPLATSGQCCRPAAHAPSSTPGDGSAKVKLIGRLFGAAFSAQRNKQARCPLLHRNDHEPGKSVQVGECEESSGGKVAREDKNIFGSLRVADQGKVGITAQIPIGEWQLGSGESGPEDWLRRQFHQGISEMWSCLGGGGGVARGCKASEDNEDEREEENSQCDFRHLFIAVLF